jgi:hypothetical protein
VNKSFPRTPFKKRSKKDIAKIFSGSVLCEQNSPETFLEKKKVASDHRVCLDG